MKRLVCVAVMCALAGGMLAGCAGGGREAHPLALYKDGKVMVELNMPMEQVKKNLGEGKITDRIMWFDDGNVSVFFRDGAVCCVITKGDAYEDAAGVSAGDTLEQAKQALKGEKLITSDSYISIVYDEEMNNISDTATLTTAEYNRVYAAKKNDTVIQTITISDKGSVGGRYDTLE